MCRLVLKGAGGQLFFAILAILRAGGPGVEYFDQDWKNNGLIKSASRNCKMSPATPENQGFMSL